MQTHGLIWGLLNVGISPPIYGCLPPKDDGCTPPKEQGLAWSKCGGKLCQLALEIALMSGESYHVQEVFMASVDGHGVEVFVDQHLYA